jgi:ribosome biogenesis GTPase A
VTITGPAASTFSVAFLESVPYDLLGMNWYPGHMTKARREIAEAMPAHDVVIEVLDARMPGSSENPVVTELRRQKPCIKVLCKSDLADPEATTDWLRYLPSRPARTFDGLIGGKVVALAVSLLRPQEARTKIPELCKGLAPNRSGPGKGVRAIVVGIPNVGKSTLINALMERKVAKVGDEPAVTKAKQRVVLKSGMALSDNPGILWPKIEDETASLRLALAGAIPDSALDYETVALFGAAIFLERYPALVNARYKLAATPASPMALLEEIARRRGGLRAGGVLDLHKASDVLIHDFRSGVLGRITLERAPGSVRIG